jgi:hypothetical protein
VWGVWLASLPVLSLAAKAEPTPTLSVLGAADEQLKFLANTAAVTTTVVVESTSPEATVLSIRVSAFRDAMGRLHPVRVSGAAGATLAGSPTAPEATLELPPVSVTARGTASFRVESSLAAEGEYSSDLFLVYGDHRDHVRLILTRASDDLGVEIQGVDAVRATASVGAPTTATLRMTLLEKTGRALTLNPVQITKFVRKEASGARAQAGFDLQMNGGTPQPFALNPNQSLPMVLNIGDLEGAGEYLGTLRIGATGSKTADQEFTISVRESGWMAFGCILLGVGLSTLLRWLSDNFRPRVVETQRTQLVIQDLDALMAEPGRQNEETVVLRALRRQAVAVLLTLESGSTEGVTKRLDSIDQRRSLAAQWIVARRRVAALLPETLRDTFWPVVDSARDVIVDEEATAEAIASASKALSGLSANIDDALRKELTGRIEALRTGVKALVARPTSDIASLAPAALDPLLDEADQQLHANDLRGALRTYAQARQAWAALLLDDLGDLIAGPPPLQVAADEWRRRVGSLKAQVDTAKGLVASDPEAAIQLYERVWARYVATVSDWLADQVRLLRMVVQQDEDLDDKQRAEFDKMFEDAEQLNMAARAATLSGKAQEAIAALSKAIAAADFAQEASKKRTRNFVSDRASGSSQLVGGVPSALSDTDGDTVVISEQTVRSTARRLTRIDLFTTLVAVIVASLLGMKTLWSSNAIWGGWEDRIVALLWGLGLQQFTFAGVSALRERLQGKGSGGAAS